MISIDFKNHFDHYELLVQNEVALEKIKKDNENKLELEQKIEKEREQLENIKPKHNISKKKNQITISKAPSDK